MSIRIRLLVILLVAIKEHVGKDIYTPPPKSKECLQRERTEKVIRIYNELTNLTLKQLFVLTREEANNFTNLIIKHEQIRKPTVRKCDRAFPKYAACKIEELGDILNETKCLIGNRTSQPVLQPADYAMRYQKAYKQWDALEKNKLPKHQRNLKKDFIKRGKFSEEHRDRKIFGDQQQQQQQQEERYQEQRYGDFTNEINNLDNDGTDFDDWERDQDANENFQRDKRSIYNAVSESQKLSMKNDDGDDDDDDTNGNTVILKEGEKIRNKDGSITEVRACLARASKTTNGNHRLTKECAVTTILPANHFPRYLNEVICDYQDSSCLKGEGAGYQKVVRITFKRDKNGALGVGKLGDWEDYVQDIRTSCSCQLLPNSKFRSFI